MDIKDKVVENLEFVIRHRVVVFGQLPRFAIFHPFLMAMSYAS